MSLNGASSKEKGKGKKGDDDDDDGDGKKKWMRYEVVESSITTTVEALEGGGTRTVYVLFFLLYSTLLYSPYLLLIHLLCKFVIGLIFWIA